MRQLTLTLTVILAIAAITAATASAEIGFLPTTTFTGKGGAKVDVSLAGTEIACKANTVLGGTMTNDKEGKIESIHFSGCKALGVFEANSLNDTAGIILVTNLTYTLCFINKSTLDMGIVLHFPAAGVHVEIPAAKTLSLITGSLIGLITPDAKRAKVFTIKFGKSATTKDQEFTKCEGGKTEVLLTETNESKKPEEGALVLEEELTTAVETELMEA